jgi:hypothetical protein
VLLEQIREIHTDSRGTYGLVRIMGQLRRRGIGVNHKRVAQLMRRSTPHGSLDLAKGGQVPQDTGASPSGPGDPSGQEFLVISTGSEWEARDLAVLADSLDRAYGRLLVYIRDLDDLVDWLKAAEPARRYVPMWPLSGLPALGWGAPMALRTAGPDEILFSPADRLTVASVQMASPGFVSLKGLGEPIRELRKLVEFLCGMRQERRMQDAAYLEKALAIGTKYLDLRARHGQDAVEALGIDPARFLRGRSERLASQLKKDLSGLEPLIDDGKVIEVTERGQVDGGSMAWILATAGDPPLGQSLEEAPAEVLAQAQPIPNFGSRSIPGLTKRESDEFWNAITEA